MADPMLPSEVRSVGELAEFIRQRLEVLEAGLRDTPEALGDAGEQAALGRILWHGRMVYGVLTGQPTDPVDAALVNYCEHYGPQIVRYCGGSPTTAATYLIAAALFCTRLELTVEDLVGETIAR